MFEFDRFINPKLIFYYLSTNISDSNQGHLVIFIFRCWKLFLHSPSVFQIHTDNMENEHVLIFKDLVIILFTICRNICGERT